MSRLSLSISIVWILLLGAGTAVAQLAEDGYDLFQQALLQETVEGDLERTIELYRRIVENFGDNRSRQRSNYTGVLLITLEITARWPHSP
jgi:hypothetical protein